MPSSAASRSRIWWIARRGISEAPPPLAGRSASEARRVGSFLTCWAVKGTSSAASGYPTRPTACGSCPPSPQGGGETRAFHRRHALLPQSGYSKNAPHRREEKSGSGARDPSLSNYYTWPGFPRPADVLALMEDTAVAAGLHQGPDLGVHHPAALPKRDRPGTAALPDTRCAPGSRESDGRIIGQGEGVLMDKREISSAFEGNQWVGREVYPRSVIPGPRSGTRNPECQR